MSMVPYGDRGGGVLSLLVPPLTPVNYTSLAIKMEAILDAQELWRVLVPAEGATIDAGKSKTTWALLLGALSEEVLMQVVTEPTTKDASDTLKVRFVDTDQVKAARRVRSSLDGRQR